MSRFFPHPPYAEDQPLAHTVLLSHTLFRCFKAGTALGVFWHVGPNLSSRSAARICENEETPSKDSTAPPSTAIAYFYSLLQQIPAPEPALVRSASLGSLVGLGIWMIILPLKMGGKEEIQWKDYSWRILENRGQVLLDDWCVSGLVGGVVMGFLAKRRHEHEQEQGDGAEGSEGKAPLWQWLLAGAGLGSLGGVVGFLVVRAGQRLLRI